MVRASTSGGRRRGACSATSVVGVFRRRARLQTIQRDLAEYFGIGQCQSPISGPLNLAPDLDRASFLPTWRVLYCCNGTVFFETIAGVGNFVSVPPPGNVSSGPAPIARGANDVAAIWWNQLVSSVQPPVVDQFLAASWVRPGPPSMILLSHGASTIAPALAATGDLFTAVWASGNEVRAMRFNRLSGPLDPDGGILVATGSGLVVEVAAASDGTNTVIGWLEEATPGTRLVRAARIAPDGTIVNATPTEIAQTTAENSAVSVAANSSAALITYSRKEPVGTSVRARLIP